MSCWILMWLLWSTCNDTFDWFEALILTFLVYFLALVKHLFFLKLKSSIKSLLFPHLWDDSCSLVFYILWMTEGRLCLTQPAAAVASDTTDSDTEDYTAGNKPPFNICQSPVCQTIPLMLLKVLWSWDSSAALWHQWDAHLSFSVKVCYFIFSYYQQICVRVSS